MKIIDRYQLEEIVGAGTYGKVFRARTTDTGEVFAIKCIPIEKFKKIRKLAEFTQNEINVLEKISHPNIVRYVEKLVTVNNTYMVYEYCSGGTLEARIYDKGHLNEDTALRYFSEILSTMVLLDRLKVLHRDIKPSNIMLHNDKIKLGDFGFCKPMNNYDFSQTMVGSPIYMAPEILKSQSYTSKVDVWSLGVVLFEMLFGKCPYEEKTIPKLIALFETQGLKIPRDINPISQNTETLLRKFLIIDPVKRTTFAEAQNFLSSYYPYCLQLQKAYNSDLEPVLQNVPGFNGNSTSPTITKYQSNTLGNLNGQSPPPALTNNVTLNSQSQKQNSFSGQNTQNILGYNFSHSPGIVTRTQNAIPGKINQGQPVSSFRNHIQMVQNTHDQTPQTTNQIPSTPSHIQKPSPSLGQLPKSGVVNYNPLSLNYPVSQNFQSQPSNVYQPQSLPQSQNFVHQGTPITFQQHIKLNDYFPMSVQQQQQTIKMAPSIEENINGVKAVKDALPAQEHNQLTQFQTNNIINLNLDQKNNLGMLSSPVEAYKHFPQRTYTVQTYEVSPNMNLTQNGQNNINGPNPILAVSERPEQSRLSLQQTERMGQTTSTSGIGQARLNNESSSKPVSKQATAQPSPISSFINGNTNTNVSVNDAKPAEDSLPAFLKKLKERSSLSPFGAELLSTARKVDRNSVLSSSEAQQILMRRSKYMILYYNLKQVWGFEVENREEEKLLALLMILKKINYSMLEVKISLASLSNAYFEKYLTDADSFRTLINQEIDEFTVFFDNFMSNLTEFVKTERPNYYHLKTEIQKYDFDTATFRNSLLKIVGCIQSEVSANEDAQLSERVASCFIDCLYVDEICNAFGPLNSTVASYKYIELLAKITSEELNLINSEKLRLIVG